MPAAVAIRQESCVRCGLVYAITADGWQEQVGDERLAPTDVCQCGAMLGLLAPPLDEPIEPPEWAENPPSLSEPVVLEEEIERLSILIERAGARLARGLKRWGRVEAEYQVRFAGQVLTIHRDYEARGERTPGEDVRRAMALEKMGAGLYESRLAWQAEVEALERYVDVVKGAMSGRQTLLNRATS